MVVLNPNISIREPAIYVSAAEIKEFILDESNEVAFALKVPDAVTVEFINVL